jgi:hypothetical protein
MKVLSPGINDTATAVMCVDYLTAILVRLADRQIESRYRAKDGELRLLTRGPTFTSLVGESCDRIRQNAAVTWPFSPRCSGRWKHWLTGHPSQLGGVCFSHTRVRWKNWLTALSPCRPIDSTLARGRRV